jgi:hypothetical protein
MWGTVPDGITDTRWEVKTYWPLFAKAEKGRSRSRPSGTTINSCLSLNSGMPPKSRLCRKSTAEQKVPSAGHGRSVCERNVILPKWTQFWQKLILESVLDCLSQDSGYDSLQGPRGWFSTPLEEAQIQEYTWRCNHHRFASRLVMAGVDLRTVAELLGHRTLQMVMRYSHLAPEHQASVVDRLVPGWGRMATKSATGKSGAKSTKTTQPKQKNAENK